MDMLEFVDTHVHFWDLTHPDLNYSWLQPDSVHPQLREQLDRLKGKNYVVDDFIAETRGANVTKAVHVQAAVGIEDPVKETEWLQQAADRTGFPQAIVAYSNLKDPRVEDELARHRGYPNVRGIRDFSEGDYLVDPDFHRGYALLERFDLVAGLDVKWENMAKMRDLAGKFPNVRAVLDHCGFPEERTDEYFESWRKGITTLAEAENVVCKISGLGMCDWSWTVDSIRPWILHCIDAFGPERCIFASNWPVDKLFSTYDVLIDAYTEIVAGFSPDEKTAMLSGNAKELYRL
jgi:predicted TIM-barrel fold metal-dependent hydrolase